MSLEPVDIYAQIQAERDKDRDLIDRLRKALGESIALLTKDGPFLWPEEQHAIAWWRLLLEETKR